jgi:Flp pilus assembly protein TadD
MTIAVTALGVLVPVRVLEARWPGGEAGYRAAAPNGTYRTDGSLAALDFASPREAEDWADRRVKEHGLAFVKDGAAVDVAVVDARLGPTVRCAWLAFAGQGGWARVTLASEPAGEPVWPPGTSARSLPPGAPPPGADPLATLQFEGIDRHAARFVDEVTGRSHHAGPISRDVLQELLSARIRALANRLAELGLRAEREGASAGFRAALRSARAEAARIEGVDGRLVAGASYVAGLSARMMGDFEPAAAHWRRFVEVAPDFPGGYLELTWCLAELGRLDEALVAARQAAELAPRDGGAIANVGRVLLARGELEAAAEWVARGRELAPDHPLTRELAQDHAAEVARRAAEAAKKAE